MSSVLDVSTNKLIQHIPSPSLSSSRRVQQRQQYASRMAVDIANETINGLNVLSSSLSAPFHDITPPLPSSNSHARHQHQLQSSTQQRLHQRIYHSSQRFCRGLRGVGCDEIYDDTYYDHSSNIEYSSAAVPPRMVDAAIVSLPAEAGTADLLSVLPPHLRTIYANPKLLVAPPAVRIVVHLCVNLHNILHYFNE
jgi:hypothetical protein